MMYFYAMGDDKAGNTLVTSYKKEEQAKKYRAGATIQEGLKYLDTEKGTLTNNDTGLLCRTIIKRGGEAETFEGPFVIYAKSGGEWIKTQFRYETYGAANTAVKGALIQLYEACAVVEEDA